VDPQVPGQHRSIPSSLVLSLDLGEPELLGVLPQSAIPILSCGLLSGDLLEPAAFLGRCEISKALKPRSLTVRIARPAAIPR